MNLKNLANPFAPEDIEWRMQQSGTNAKGPWGKCLAYVTNRAIMDRLDAVCGPEGWKNEFTKAPDGGILCGLSIGCKNVGSATEWVTKWDGAQNTDVEAVKGGLSNAMKRAAVQWGIGRYLYNLETGWADFTTNGKYSAKMKDGTYHKWNPPQLPKWALPTTGPTPKNDDAFLPEVKMEKGPQEMTTESFLQKMKGYAQFEPQAYQKVLGFWQITSAKQITNPESQAKIIKEIMSEITGG